MMIAVAAVATSNRRPRWRANSLEAVERNRQRLDEQREEIRPKGSTRAINVNSSLFLSSFLYFR
jgi:hypothetical protein